MKCVICDNSKLVVHRLDVSGDVFPLCEGCAQAVRQGRPGRAFDDLGCLHMMAMEVEQQLDTGLRAASGKRRIPNTIPHRFRQGYFRDKCPCRTCEEVRQDQLAERPWPGRKPEPSKMVSPDEIGVTNGVLNETVRAAILATFNPDVVLTDRDGVEWTPKDFLRRESIKNNREATAHPGVKPGGLADQARDPSVFGAEMNAKSGVNRVWYHRPDQGQYSYGPLDPARRKVDDDIAKAFWADRSKLGHDQAKLRDIARRQPLLVQWPHLHPGLQFGYYDGPYWVDAITGECFTLPLEW